jgi:aminopeptidase N
VAINVNGIEGGMEYPMIVFCRNRTDPAALFSVTDHEIGHTWFPMVVGNNERLYAWMDEGLNTFMNHYSWEKKYPGAYNRRGDPGLYLPLAVSGREDPIATPADRIRGSLSVTGYTKPGLGLILLRDRIVGPERFDPAFKGFIARWAFKHPTPADFFRSIEDGVGEDLSWFWRSWFYTTEVLDQAVDSVVAVTDSTGSSSKIYLRNAGQMPMPVELELTVDDGSTVPLKLPVEVWYGGSSYVATVPGQRKVVRVVIDPKNFYPDIRRENNRWSAAATPGAPPPIPRKTGN